METKTWKLYEVAVGARSRYWIGAISRDNAIKTIAQYINHANKKGKRIAKHHSRKFRPFSVSEFLR